MQRLQPLLFILVALTMLFTLACSQSSTPATPSPTPLTAVEIISRASEKLQSATSFHFALDQVGGGTPIAMGIQMVKMSGDVIKPDKLKATVTGTFMNSTLEVQLITLGDTTYMTNPLSGKWEVIPEQFKILSVFDPSSGVAAILKGLISPARLPEATVAGVVCYHIKGSLASEVLIPITGSSAAGATISAEVWIGKDDFMVRDIKLEGKITATEVDGIVRTLSLSNYNQALDIQPPQ